MFYFTSFHLSWRTFTNAVPACRIFVPSRYAQAALLCAQKKGETSVDISKPRDEEEEE